MGQGGRQAEGERDEEAGESNEERRQVMAVYKRGKVWWFKFTFNGEPFRESTKQTNKRVAEQIEAARKTGLAKGDVGIRDRAPVQTFEEFAKTDFLPHVESRFADKTGTLAYYRIQVGHLLSFAPIANAKLDAVSAEAITGFIEKRRQAKYEVATINRALQVLRRMLRLAVEWGRIDKTPTRITLLSGENRRERVLSHQEESGYLKAAVQIGEAAIAAYERALHAFAPLSAATSRQNRRTRSFCETWQPCCSTADYVPMNATASNGSNTGKGAFISREGKPQRAADRSSLGSRRGDTRNAATGDRRRLDLSSPNAQRACRAFEPEEAAREGVPTGQVRTRSALHLPSYLPDAMVGTHGPVLSRVLRGA
jgi:hypothetical protein